MHTRSNLNLLVFYLSYIQGHTDTFISINIPQVNIMDAYAYYSCLPALSKQLKIIVPKSHYCSIKLQTGILAQLNIPFLNNSLPARCLFV